MLTLSDQLDWLSQLHQQAIESRLPLAWDHPASQLRARDSLAPDAHLSAFKKHSQRRGSCHKHLLRKPQPLEGQMQAAGSPPCMLVAHSQMLQAACIMQRQHPCLAPCTLLLAPAIFAPALQGMRAQARPALRSSLAWVAAACPCTCAMSWASWPRAWQSWTLRWQTWPRTLGFCQTGSCRCACKHCCWGPCLRSP